MSNRTQRRAAERLQQKLAAQELRQSQPVSAIQLAANRANAKLSSGPVTPEGRAISAQNALKHALTSATVLLPTDNAAEYEHQLDSFITSLKPATEEELHLVQSMVDCMWRIARAQRLEAGLLFKGQLEFANKFPDHSAAERASLINVETYLKYEKSLRNLNIQEARLHRRYEKDQAELNRLQAERKRQERIAASQPPVIQPPALKPENGFVFSTPENAATFNPQTDVVSVFSVGAPIEGTLSGR